MTTVVSKYHVNMDDPDIVYIGRGSIWGNPHVMKNNTDEERQEAVEKYRKTLWELIEYGLITKEMLLELDGKRLACFCKPKDCHGDVIVSAIEWAKKG